jgi:hypothetical protein
MESVQLQGFRLHFDRIADLAHRLPQGLLTQAPKTHFPVQLPLAFPSDLHHINLLTILHLVSTTISQPRHTHYLAEQLGTDASTISIRGVFGLFLASDATWAADNLLSLKSWKMDKMTEERVAEFFGIEVMREKSHPTLPVKIGERWLPGVELAGDLVALFKRLGEKVQMRCIGEAVLSALGHAAEAYSRAFCEKVGHRQGFSRTS